MIKPLFQPAPLSARASAGLLVLRVVAGIAFIMHGWGKIQHPTTWAGPEPMYPAFLLFLAAFSEFAGGIGWLLGLLTPLASFGIACVMAFAVQLHAFVMHDAFIPDAPGKGAWELPAIYFCVAVLFALVGPGRFSADRCVFGQKAV
jgi:putative oxidoreductase